MASKKKNNPAQGEPVSDKGPAFCDGGKGNTVDRKEQVNCMLPGADLVAQGATVEEALEKERQKHAGGRPTTKTKEVTDKILIKLMEGKSLVKICREEGMPVYSTVCLWLANDKEFSESYVRAREVQADYIFDEALDIADDSGDDEILTDDGRRLLNKEFVARSKLRVETRLRMAGKLSPKKYGDKIAQEVTGANGSPLSFPPLTLNLTVDKNEPDAT